MKHLRSMVLWAGVLCAACLADTNPGSLQTDDTLSSDSGAGLGFNDATPNVLSPADAGSTDGSLIRDDVTIRDGRETASDTGSTVDAPVIPGLWLIGWPGGLDHFDWFRFHPLEDGATLRWAAPQAEGSLVPWTGCVGVSRWTWVRSPDTVRFDIPEPCAGMLDLESPLTLTFEVSAKDQNWPQHALMHGTVTTSDATWNQLVVYKYPEDWCDADLVACAYPFP